eukprot:783933-Pelagomonas_calceolata.AAC.5
MLRCRREHTKCAKCTQSSVTAQRANCKVQSAHRAVLRCRREHTKCAKCTQSSVTAQNANCKVQSAHRAVLQCRREHTKCAKCTQSSVTAHRANWKVQNAPRQCCSAAESTQTMRTQSSAAVPTKQLCTDLHDCLPVEHTNDAHAQQCCSAHKAAVYRPS